MQEALQVADIDTHSDQRVDETPAEAEGAPATQIVSAAEPWVDSVETQDALAEEKELTTEELREQFLRPSRTPSLQRDFALVTAEEVLELTLASPPPAKTTLTFSRKRTRSQVVGTPTTSVQDSLNLLLEVEMAS